MPRSTIDEFKKFIRRGNVVDLAVGIVIGAAFTAIVQSLVKDIVNPVLGVLTDSLDFSGYYISLNAQQFDTLAQARAAGAPVLAWGSFLTSVINFLIIAWVVFLLIKAVNKIEDIFEGDDEEVAETQWPKKPTTEDILIEIRDVLKEGKL